MHHPLQAHPGPTLQVLDLLMQLSPQAFPVVHVLQHVSAVSQPVRAKALPPENRTGARIMLTPAKTRATLVRIVAATSNVLYKRC